MRKTLMVVLVLAMVALVSGAALADTADDEVTVTVEELDLLSVPATTALTLTATDPGATAYTQATATDADGLNYTHNSATSKKITATAVADGENGSNDITLTVTIEGQTTTGTVVSAGVDQADVVLWTGIVADGYTLDLEWTADGTLAETLAGDYVWTVTFTSADA